MKRLLATAFLLAQSSCGAPATGTAEAQLDPALAPLVLSELPRDVQHRTLIDFEGKVQLVGYDVEPPGGVIRPGERFKLRLYWRSVAPLRQNWSLFTHIVDSAGETVLNADRYGALRSPGSDGQAKLPLSQWKPGKIYVDEQELEMPRMIRSRATVLVGLWRPALMTQEMAQSQGGAKLSGLRLAVISGPADRSERGIVLHIDTGVTPPPRLVRSKKT